MNRRGMEIAINTLVVLILGIVIITGGILLLRNIYVKAIELPEQVSQQTEDALFNMLLSSKQRIAVLHNVQDIQRKKSALYPIAFQNQLEGAVSCFRIVTTDNPEIVVEPSASACIGGGTPDTCPKADVLADEWMLDRYESNAIYAGVAVPKAAQRGEYVFQLVVQARSGCTVGQPCTSCTDPYADYARAKFHAIVE